MKMQISRHFRKQLMFNMLFTSSLIILLGLVFLGGVYSYSRWQTGKDCEDLAGNLAGELEAQLDDLQMAAVQAAFLPWVRSYANSDIPLGSMDVTTLSSNIGDMVGLKAISPVIRNVAMVFQGQEDVITDYGIRDISDLWMSTFNTRYSSTSPLARRLKLGEFRFIAQLPTMKDTSLFVKTVGSAPAANLFVYVDSSRLMYEISRTLGESPAWVDIIDQDGHVVLSNASGVLAGQSIDGLRVESRVTDYDWRVVLVFPESVMSAAVSHNMLLASLVILAMLLLGIPASIYLAMKNYAPIRRLISLSPDKDMEYESLFKAIELMFSQDGKDKSLDNFRPLLAQSLLQELFSPSAPVALITDGLAELRVRFDRGDSYALVAFTRFTASLDIRLFQHEDIAFYLADKKGECDIFVINGTRQVLESYLEALACDTERDDSYISFTPVRTFPEELEKTYREMERVLQYRSTGEDVMYISSCQLPESDTRFVDLSAMGRLEAALKAAKAREARSLLEEIFERNILSLEVVRIDTLEEIRSNIVKMLADIETQMQVHCDAADALGQWNINSYDSVTSLMELSMQACADTAREILHIQESGKDRESREMLSFLDSNIYNPAISLTMMANAFSTSESRISRSIRQITGYGFLDYVNSHRIETAGRRLLEEPEIGISTLAIELGYTNDITFRRLFKKSYGISPGEYRSQNAKGKAESAVH